MDPEREILWLRRTRDLSHHLASERDVKKLLPLILDAAIELSGAERGYLVIVRGRKPDRSGYKFKVEVARGFDRSALAGSTGEVSRTVVRRVLELEREGIVTTDDAHRDVLQVSSVQARRVVAIAAVPLVLRGQIKGVLYLDHRSQPDVFDAEHLPLLRTFSDQAALALETAEIHAGVRPSGEELGEVVEPPPPERDRCGRLLGSSPHMLDLYEDLARAARTWEPVLLHGEPGVGKSLIARELHEQGSFPQEPFCRVDCRNNPQLEVELFGDSTRPGAFVRAAQGSLLLVEIGGVPPELQGRLVDVLQTRRLPATGGGRGVDVRARVIATSSADLRAAVDAGRVRADLYYRLDVLRLVVPPLRERPGDIPQLFRHFLEFTGRRFKLSTRAHELLLAYAWPGNVRELENEVRRLAALGRAEVSATQLSTEIREGRGVSRASGDLSGRTLAEVEQHMVEAAMRECGGNKSRAARQLGIPRTTLYHLLERYGLA